jgi:hypothetical protein
MARKITTQACNAFMSAKGFTLDNTTVSVFDGKIVLSLHGHTIARREVGSNEIQITNAGWFSNTTKERLNGLPGVSVVQRKGVWFLNGKEWNGEWVTV